MRLVVLYEELASYFVECLKEFVSSTNADVLLVRKKVNKEAPFEFHFNDQKIKVINFEEFSPSKLQQEVNKFGPTHIFSGGWKTKTYLEICKSYKNSIPVVVGFDNQWVGSLKQIAASLLSPFYVKKYFNRCFVPGSSQKKFALKLGFKEDQISLNAYSADVARFNAFFGKHLTAKRTNYPKRFIYVGRYVPHKGIKELWQAFIELSNEINHDWELWCIGTGTVEPISHPKIKHFGFIQPEEMEGYILNTGVFVLPSKFEPWGVVVHEFAASGFPLLLSEKVGAKEVFLTENENGFVFDPENISEIKNALKKIINLEDKKLLLMGRNSHESAKKITPKIWSESLLNLFEHDIRN